MEWEKGTFSLATLETPKNRGGFNLPNLQLYHWAFTLSKFIMTVLPISHHGPTSGSTLCYLVQLKDAIYIKLGHRLHVLR